MTRICLMSLAIAVVTLASSCSGEYLRANGASPQPQPAGPFGFEEDRNVQSSSNIAYAVAASTRYAIAGASATSYDSNAMGPGVAAILYEYDALPEPTYNLIQRAKFSFPKSNAQNYLQDVSVAIDDTEIAVVGLPNYEGGGIVALYSRNETGWGLIQTLTPPSASSSKFGLSVGVSGSSLIVGDGGDKAFIFARDESSGTFSLTQTLPGDGGNVGIKNNLAVVGYKKVTGGPMVSVYQLSANGEWKEIYAPECPDCISDKDYGLDVAVSASTVAVSTNVLNATTNKYKGYVYALNMVDGAWSFTGTFEDYYNFGQSVAVLDKCVIVGQPAPDGGAFNLYLWMDDKWTWTGGISGSGSYQDAFVALGGDGSDAYPYVTYNSDADMIIQWWNNGGSSGVCK